jgi:hypothetical protein
MGGGAEQAMRGEEAGDWSYQVGAVVVAQQVHRPNPLGGAGIGHHRPSRIADRARQRLQTIRK